MKKTELNLISDTSNTMSLSGSLCGLFSNAVITSIKLHKIAQTWSISVKAVKPIAQLRFIVYICYKGN